MTLKMREGYVPPPPVSLNQQLSDKISHNKEIRIWDDLKRWLIVGNYALPLDRIDRMSTMPGNKLELLLSDGASVTVSVPDNLLVENLVTAIVTEEISRIPFPAIFHPVKEG